METNQISDKHQLQLVIAAWLNENGIMAEVETSFVKHDVSWISVAYENHAFSIAVNDGLIRLGGQGINNDINLASPDSLDVLVRRIRSLR